MLSNEMSNNLLKLFEEEYDDKTDFDNISSILPENKHYLCKECLKFPKIFFLENQEVKFDCDCKNRNKEIEIQDIFSYLSNISIENNINNNIICLKHNEKFSYYCTKCKKDLCLDCSGNCNKNRHFLIDLINDRTTRKRIKKILNPIKEKYLKCIKNNDEILESEEDSHFLSESNDTILIDFKNNTYKNNNNNKIKNIFLKMNQAQRKKNKIEEREVYFNYLSKNKNNSFTKNIINENINNKDDKLTESGIKNKISKIKIEFLDNPMKKNKKEKIINYNIIFENIKKLFTKKIRALDFKIVNQTFCSPLVNYLDEI